ncbi:MAG: hypothetical protein CM15mP49_04840 [Actinomycetota bacterium]|nr:MAG: hypothetical protein CM15mP49_04840 [Actinomycetota bacterium]
MWINVDQDPHLLLTVPALMGSGIGMASVWPTLTSIGANAIGGDSIGSGTSIIHTIQRIGGALGIAIVLAVISGLSESGAFIAHRSAILVMPIAGAMALFLSFFSITLNATFAEVFLVRLLQRVNQLGYRSFQMPVPYY